MNLLAGGPEGTTIVFQGGTDKVFGPPSLKNNCGWRLNSARNFKHKILQNTLPKASSATIEAGNGAPFPASPDRRRHRQRARR